MATAKDDQTQGESLHLEETWTKTDEEAPVTVSSARSSLLVRKFDRRVLPIVSILYILSYLDRSNIGNANTAGLSADLGLSSLQFSWVLYSFYICYVLFEWTTILWKVFPAHVYIAILCICWGVTAMCAGTVHSMAGLIADRCFLGIFEAAFGAGAPYYLSLFYHRQELGLRVSLLLGTSPLANCFAGALAYGITQMKHSLAPWRLLFLIEGAPTILFAPVVFFFLPDSPESAKFLTEDERTEAVERLQLIDTTSRRRVDWHQFFSGLTDYKNYIHMAIHFCCNYSFAGLSNFLPTIIMDMGFTSVRAQGLTAPPYLAAFLCCIAAAYLSDRLGVRGYVVSAFGCMGTIGYILLVSIQDQTRTGPRYLGVWFATCGVFPALALNITWLLNNQGGDSKRGSGMVVLAVLGQCSSFVSSSVFPREDGPLYVKGCAIGCAFTGMIVVLALALHFKLEHENAKRDRLYGAVDRNARIDVTNDGDNNPRFRYLT